MREILGKAKTVRELLQGQKYAIDFYQREYRWRTKQVSELLDDLTSRFIEDYEEQHDRREVENYGHYFLGSIIISRKHNHNYIVDGQQRLTTLTLLLIYLNGMQSDSDNIDRVPLLDLIFSTKYGQKSFNIDVDERLEVMEALLEGSAVDPNGQAESVQNIIARYEDIQELFPEELTENALPYFLDWLLENVHLVEITAYSDHDAYTVFETMNDRGLSLTPTEMLKGYLLANIVGSQQKTRANNLWKSRVQDLNELGRDTDSDFFKAWLRSQYANTIRERKRGARPQEFDRIGTEFHRYVRDYREALNLNGSESYIQFLHQDFNFFSKQYMRLIKASRQPQEGLETAYYNAQHGFTLQYMILLAPLLPDDAPEVINHKLYLVGTYLDILLNRRIWNFRSIAYSTMQYAMFILMKDIRRLPPETLAANLYKRLEEDKEDFAANNRLRVHQQNRKYLHRILARMTLYIEQEAEGKTVERYKELTNTRGRHGYEVEHIWANKPERHEDEFDHPIDFQNYRDRIGGLLLLPKSFNASYGALPYEEKLPHYYSQNLLARSLNPQCYVRNPGFLNFMSRIGLPFKPHEHFKKNDLDERQMLYRLVAEKVWNPTKLLEGI